MMGAAAAHEGHGRAEWQSGLLHYLLEPEHAVLAAILLAGAMTVAILSWRRARRRAGPPAVG
jgi:hypothetical protein